MNEPPHGQFGFVRWDTRLSLVVNNSSGPLSVAFGNQPARELFRMCQDPLDDRLYFVRAGGGWQDRALCAGFPNKLLGDVKVFVQATGLPTCATWE